MELLSPLQVSNDRSGPLRGSIGKLETGANRLLGWLTDKSRQLRSLTANETLAKALLSAEKAPAEGTRLAIGETINVYHADGSRTRLRICGVRSGGFSNAYSVIDLDEMRAYCLKENRALPGDENERNQSLAVEAEILLRLGRHPHLVTAHSAFYYRSRLYLLTEYLPEESLDVSLKRRRLSLEESVDYAIQICRAMEYAQAKLPGFVHGDIKPGNCLLASDGRLKLGDLGLSSAIGIAKHGRPEPNDPSNSSQGSTRHGWGGTTPYMAPEMFDRSSGRHNSDVYALGVTLFEMIAGARPFSHSSKSELIEMHRSADPPLEDLRSMQVPEPLLELIQSCLAKSPTDRPQSFHEVEFRLGQLAADYLNLFVPDADADDDSPDNDAARVSMSFAAIERFQAAAVKIDYAAAEAGRSAELLALKAIILSSAGDIEAAYEASTAALMMRVDLFIVLLAHARVLIAKGNLENSQEYLERAHRMEAGNCVVLNLLGEVCRRNGEFDDGIKYLLRSLMIDPAQPETLAILARIQLDRGRNMEAAESATRALSFDPDCSEGNLILAEARFALGDIVEGVKAYKNALRHGGDSKKVRHKYVRACMSMVVPSAGVDKVAIARTLLLGARLLSGEHIDLQTTDRFVEEVLDGVAHYGADVIFFHDLTLAKLTNGPGIGQYQRLGRALKGLHDAGAVCGPLPYHLEYSIGRVLYHLDELDHCELVFQDMLNRFGPNESSYYFLAACSEIREDNINALAYYRKANQLLDCEDSRTGIRRVGHQLRKSSEQVAL